MILTIDIGNSRVKWVRFQGDVIVDQYVFSYEVDTLADYLNQASLPLDTSKVVISSVASEAVVSVLTSFLINSGCRSYRFAATQAEQCGVVNSYREYSALGIDRWMAMIAGFNHPEKKLGQAVCVIDCGTAMTLDVVDGTGRHLGGVIAPGFKLMQSMLNNKTSNIQVDVEPEAFGRKWLSLSTLEAVKQGCAGLLIGGLNSMLKRCMDEQGDVLCVVTGGDGDWVSDGLEMEVVYEPLLVNQGLLRISYES